MLKTLRAEAQMDADLISTNEKAREKEREREKVERHKINARVSPEGISSSRLQVNEARPKAVEIMEDED
jgi:hypothetical protein